MFAVDVDHLLNEEQRFRDARWSQLQSVKDEAGHRRAEEERKKQIAQQQQIKIEMQKKAQQQQSAHQPNPVKR